MKYVTEFDHEKCDVSVLSAAFGLFISPYVLMGTPVFANFLHFKECSFCSRKREVGQCEEGRQAQRQTQCCFLTDELQQSVTKLVCRFGQSSTKAGRDVPIDYLLLATEEMPAAVRKCFEVCDDIVSSG